MAQRFTPAQWQKIHDLFDAEAETGFGLPAAREQSIVLASFNIRKLGKVDSKSPGAWELLAKICSRFDLVAVQEVQDDLSGLVHLKELLNAEGDVYGMVASDITGDVPGGDGQPERLAFLFRWQRVARTEVASDISYDRTAVVSTLYDGRIDIWESFDEHTLDLAEYEARREAGKRPKRPTVALPRFVTFMRQPLCVSFRVPAAAGAAPYEFLAVNAHLLYGDYPEERTMEFLALMEWLVIRAKEAERMYHPNLLLLGDLNLDFEKVELQREQIDGWLRSLNLKRLKSKKAAKLNFPFLDTHPTRAALPPQEQPFRTNARKDQTYDQIGFVIHDPRLPRSDANDTAGSAPDAYDFGMVDFVELFSRALHGKSHAELTASQRTALYAKFEHDFSDHMPIWVRLPRP